MIANFVQFQQHGDQRGSLVALEDEKNIPFAIRRVYFMYRCAADVRRGFHAHHALQQVVFPVSGSCKILLDDGSQKTEVVLDSPARGLLVDPMVWHEMWAFSDDCVLMALASDHYTEADYIRDYPTFLQLATK